ncbi:MAG: hypothetical protein SF182_12205 [Deltaproteobacteria bacterium]|nr:hypothetical protein [Deltaproteobacteria bacterium]
MLLLVGAGGAAAQPSGLTVEDLPDPSAATPTEPQPTATDAVATPTRRPTRPPLPTATASASATASPADTETPTAVPPTAVPPTATAPRTRVPSSTPTTIPTATASPTPTRAWLAAITGGNDDPPPLFPLVAGGLLTLLGAWLGARIAGAGERRERGRARRSLASAMLLELRRLDAVLRRVVALDNPAAFPSLEHPIIEGALRDLTLFDTETAARVAQFHGALRGIQHEIGDYRDNPLRWAGRLGELNQLIKSRAAAACRAVPELARALERSGATPPPALHEPAASGGDPARLPPPPFGASDGDDWTL